MKCNNFFCRGHSLKYKKWGNCSKASLQKSLEKTAPDLYWDINMCEVRKRYNKTIKRLNIIYPPHGFEVEFKKERDKYYGRNK